MSEGARSYWRRVVAAGAVYGAAGWGAVEALTTIVDRLGLPAWLDPLVTALYIAGLPVTVFLVWRTAGEERRLDALSFVGAMAVLVVVTGAIFWQTRPAPAEPGQLVAVLPCDFSGDVSQKYRAEGLAEDVHARLSRVSAIKIASWNSSLFVRDRGLDTPAIVDLLNADRLVRCRMTSGPERIELTAELLDPKAGRILWNRDYDFVASDMSTVVTEVAGTLLDVLGARVEAGERKRVSALGTFSPEAYDLFLRARVARDDREKGQPLVEKALEIDPEFADALVLDAVFFLDRATSEEFESMQEAKEWMQQGLALARRALAADPGVFRARHLVSAACSLLEGYFEEPCDGVDHDKLMAEECEIRGDTAEGWACRHHLWASQDRDNRAALDRWLELEPTSVDANAQYMGELWYEGRRAEALSVFETLRMLAPDDLRPYGLVSNALRGEGRLDESFAWRYGSYGDSPEQENPWRLARLAGCYAELGMYDRAIEFAERTWQVRRASALHLLPGFYVLTGRKERAAELLEWEVTEIGTLSRSSLVWAAYPFADPVGDFRRAREIYDQAFADNDLRELCDGPQCVVENALNLVRIERALGRDDAALAWLHLAESELGDKRPDDEADPDAMVHWALLRTAQGRGEEAVELLRKAVFTRQTITVGNLAIPLYRLRISTLLDPLREMPEFQALLDDYESWLAPMRDRVIQAEASGDWESLRQQTYAWVNEHDGQPE